MDVGELNGRSLCTYWTYKLVYVELGRWLIHPLRALSLRELSFLLNFQ